MGLLISIHTAMKSFHVPTYAGIGSRKTPPRVLDFMQYLGWRLARNGYLLRSGAAAGADTAFETGCTRAQGQKEIWVPWSGFGDRCEPGFVPLEGHFALAQDLHPKWHFLSAAARKLHARNVGQILGADLASPVDFVVCWTPDGCSQDSDRTAATGGTGTAIALASRHGIPVFNLQADGAYEQLVAHLLWMRDAIAARQSPVAADLSPALCTIPGLGSLPAAAAGGDASLVRAA